MRRLSAILLILLFAGVPVFAALAVTAASSDVPDCCKKGGAHMCSIRRSRAKREDGKPRLSAVCPFAGKTTLAVTGQRTGIAVDDSSTSALVPTQRTIRQPSVLVPALARHFENPKRGPPFVLSNS